LTGAAGDADDNAMCASFFATIECELLDRNRFRSHIEASMAVFRFIDVCGRQLRASLRSLGAWRLKPDIYPSSYGAG
jgi:hypothetical protein